MSDAVSEPARLTPYELVFGYPEYEESEFPAILGEAEERGVDASSPDRFLFLARAGRLAQRLGREAVEEGAPEPGDALERYGLFLFQAFQFWRFGRRLFLLEEGLARRLVDGPPEKAAWELTPPHPAGYLQLPRHLFWASTAEQAPPEAVDGFFWSMIGEMDAASPPYPRLELLLALGVRPGRSGVSAMAVGEELPAAPPGHWAEAEGRPGGRDFANILPGGELQRLYSLVTRAEALKLASLCFRYLALHPESVAGPERAPEGAAPASVYALPPSGLVYQRVRLVGEREV